MYNFNIVDEIKNLIKEGCTKEQIHNLFDEDIGKSEVERYWRNFKHKTKKEEKREKEFNIKLKSLKELSKTDIYLKCDNNNYNTVVNMILKGKTIDEMYDPNDLKSKKNIVRTLKLFEFLASHVDKNIDGSWREDENLVELLKTVQGTPLDTTIMKVKSNLDEYNRCEFGKIDNIIINVFNGNRYKAYYTFKRMETDIYFADEYDEPVYNRLKKETELKLYELSRRLDYIERKFNKDRGIDR